MDGWLRLRLTGELDLASAPVLDDRLTRLRALKTAVMLDLSELDFIDSTGIHLLVRVLGEARAKHWELRIERNVSHQVMRLFKLVHIEHWVFEDESDVPAPGPEPLPSASADMQAAT